MTTTETKIPYKTVTLEFRDIYHVLRTRVAIADRMNFIKERIQDSESTLTSTLTNARLLSEWKDLQDIKDLL